MSVTSFGAFTPDAVRQLQTILAPINRLETIGQKLRRLEWAARTSNPLINPPLQAVIAWAASTTYAVGDVRSNGGNDYICYAGGTSAASGGPTGTGANAITDNTVTWFFFRVTPTLTNSAIAPALSTVTSAPSGLTNIYIVQTNDANFYYAGGVPLLAFGGYRFATATSSPSTGNVSATSNNYYWATSFLTDAPKLAIRVGASLRPYYLIVDGQYVTLSGTNPNVGGTFWIVLDFTSNGGRKVRRITVESDTSSDFISANVDPQSQVWAPDASDNIRAIVIGDSYTSGGNSFPIAGLLSWPAQAGKLLGWSDIWNSGIGGTGYINNNSGNSLNFQGRLSDVTTHAPDVVMIMGGINDTSFPPSQVQSAVLAYLQAIRNAGIAAPIIVTGIFGSNAGAAQVSTENAILLGMRQFSDPLIYFIPIATDPTGPWSTGSGRVNAPTGTGNNDVYISSDSVHPVQSGIDFMAYRLANAIRNVIQQIP